MAPREHPGQGPKRIVMIRHGSTEWSVEGKHTGRTDIPLNTRGEIDALSLQSRISAFDVVQSYSSPLNRAAHTAELAGLHPMLLPDLMEWDYGDYEGITTKTIHEDHPKWALFLDGCPSGESAVEVGIRADNALRTIRSQSASEDTVAVVGHGHMLRVFAARWLGLAPEQGVMFVLDTASISVLDYEHGLPVLYQLNG